MAVVVNATPTTSSTDAQAPPDEQKPTKKGYGWRFWAIFPSLCIRGLLSALDTTILSTVLPTIYHDLDSQDLYVWAINGYFVSQTAVQPLYGQVANIFARRWPAILSVALFALGSGLCGGASSTEMLIAARVIQGLGGGGISVMTEIIVADLVPLRERQQVMGIIFTAFAVGTFIGPVVGGAIVDHTSWRWVFYINLPFSTVTAKLKRVDFAGNAILITSVISILPALIWAGTTHPWDWASLFLPVYFQLVLEARPEKSGFDLFASVIPMVPGAIVGGVLITVTGKYKPLLVAGFVLMAIGIGLFTMLDDRTKTVRWIVYQVILALGAGISLIATLPVVLASLPESNVATATATWAFLRSLGSICGVSIPSAIFNARFTDLVGRIASPQFQGVLVGGGAYQLATKAFRESLDDTPVVKAQVVSVYVDSLKLVWQAGIAFAALGVPLSLLIRSLALRDELNTEFGVEGKKTGDVEEVRV